MTDVLLSPDRVVSPRPDGHRRADRLFAMRHGVSLAAILVVVVALMVAALRARETSGTLLAFLQVTATALGAGFLVARWRDAEAAQIPASPTTHHDSHSEPALAVPQPFDWIGPLASGVATEMTTPLQYMSDNAVFLQESFTSLLTTCDGLAVLARQSDPTSVDAYLAQADMEFLRSEIPGALEQTQQGLGTIRETVGAMAASLNLGGELADIDLNGVIANVVTVSRSEWRDVATLDLQLDNVLRTVRCHADQINQMLVHLVVHAARSIKEGTGSGMLTIGTAVVGDRVRITIRHTGRRSDAVSRGVHDLSSIDEIVAAHHGSIVIDPVDQEGSSMFVDLPIGGPSVSVEQPCQ